MIPSPPKPVRPPQPPTQADASIAFKGQDINQGYETLINTSPTGLKTKAVGQKKTLIGGAA